MRYFIAKFNSRKLSVRLSARRLSTISTAKFPSSEGGGYFLKGREFNNPFPGRTERKDDSFSIFIVVSIKEEKKARHFFSDRTPFLPYTSSPLSSNVLNETFPFLTSGTWVFNPIALSEAMSNKEPRFQAHRSLSQPPLFSPLPPLRTRPFALFPSCNHTTALFPRHLTLRYSLFLFSLSFFLFISPVIISNHFLCFRKDVATGS